MQTKSNSLSTFLADIAESIRVVEGGKELINPQDFSARIIADLYPFPYIEKNIERLFVPAEVTRLGLYVFAGCYKLKTAVIEAKCDTAPYGMCRQCYTLESVKFGDSFTNLGGEAFSNCTKLKLVDIPDGVKSIGWAAFLNCTSLTSLTLPRALETIESAVFEGCTSCLRYDFTKCLVVPTLAATRAFNGIHDDCKIVVPDALYDTWIAATNWATFESHIIKQSEEVTA